MQELSHGIKIGCKSIKKILRSKTIKPIFCMTQCVDKYRENE